jgi:cyclic pyranopterin phosphate synthase
MLTHINEKNNPKMVDVGDKNITKRVAVASGIITMNKDAFESVINQTNKKGAVLQTAIIAGIMGSKKTSELIPMCHNILIDGVDVDIEIIENGFKVISTAKTTSKTGIEMEALVSVSTALLTIYDMVKAIDKSMVISEIKLEKKSGGKSGDYSR